MKRRPRIAICDYVVTRRSPSGSCNLALLEGLCEQIDFTVFAGEFNNPRPDRIQFVKVPIPRRPLALIYLVYQLLVLPVFWMQRLKGLQFDLVQSTESYSLLGDVCYAHFGHSSYLRHHWSAPQRRGLADTFRWLDHWLRSLSEKAIYARARHVVVPSRGLKRDLGEECSIPANKIVTISNPVDSTRFSHPSTFDRTAFRESLGFEAADTVAVFAALGHFERKGLPHILEAMATLNAPGLKLLVVGGTQSLVAEYRGRARRIGLESSVVFTGMQEDVSPFFWSSDLFLFPSSYETFSLVTFQAAAAGLPLLVTALHGVEELLHDGANGILLQASTAGVVEGMTRFLRLATAERSAMGIQAAHAAKAFDTQTFVEAWARFYSTALCSSQVASRHRWERELL